MSQNAKAHFNKLPVTLYRMTLGGKVRIRQLAADLSNVNNYDVETENDKVKSKCHDLQNYSAPNGVSMRPLNQRQIRLVREFNGKNVQVACIPKGTEIPKKLVIIHEWTKGFDSHYSLQPSEDMPLSEFQSRVQDFLKSDPTPKTQHEWLLEHQPPVYPTGPNKEPLKWGVDHKSWYYTDSKTKKHVFVDCKEIKK